MNNSSIDTRLKAFKILFNNEIKLIRIDYLLSDDNTFDNFSDQEIKFIHKIVYGVIRNKSKLDYYIKQCYDGNFKKLLIKHRMILRIGLFQLIYMDSIPDYAAVNTTVDLCKKIDKSRSQLINAVMRALSDYSQINDDASLDIDVKYSHPKWLVDKWLNQWDEDQVKDLLNWNNTEPRIWFRINSKDNLVGDIYRILDKNSINFKKNEILDEYFCVSNVQEMLNSKIMKQGMISVQNPANGLVVKLLDPQENETIVDGCCAPGGKSTYINELTKGNIKIHAYDNSSRRLELMSKALKKNKTTSIKYHKKDLISEAIDNYDKGIIDVPCTGTGVISKRVDVKWRRKITDLDEMNDIQNKILENVSKYLNKNGVLVYSTCSIEEEENWLIIDKFLNSNHNFELDRADKFIPSKFVDKNGCLSIFPPNHKLDGVFAARLIKK